MPLIDPNTPNKPTLIHQMTVAMSFRIAGDLEPKATTAKPSHTIINANQVILPPQEDLVDESSLESLREHWLNCLKRDKFRPLEQDALRDATAEQRAMHVAEKITRMLGQSVLRRLVENAAIPIPSAYRIELPFPDGTETRALIMKQMVPFAGARSFLERSEKNFELPIREVSIRNWQSGNPPSFAYQ